MKINFKEWLQSQEGFSPVTFPSITNLSPNVGLKLKQLTAFPDGEAKVPRWRRRLKTTWWKKDDN